MNKLQISFVCLVLCLVFQAKAADQDLPVVSNFEVSKYLGHWYLIAGIPSIVDSFCVCTQTTYTLDTKNSSLVDFDEFCHVSSTSGRVIHSHSYAEVDPVEKAKWINVNTIIGSLAVRADYYIIDIEPSYQWALVGSRSRGNLYVLAREKVLSDDVYSSIIAKATSLGFNVSKVEKTNQSCTDASFLSLN